MKIHLDTDIGGDIDDLCALALLLRRSVDLEITGITTVGEIGGKRAGYVRYILSLEGRDDIPVRAGAETSGGYYKYDLGLLPEERYWPEPVLPAPNSPEEAVQLLKESIEDGAVLVGIGPFTNFYLLEQKYPGILATAKIYLMGGWLNPPRLGFPAWGNEMDFNIQADVRSSRLVLERSNPVLIPLSVTVETSLRRSYLKTLGNSGRLGQLIVRQAEEFALDERHETRYGVVYPGLPDDTINFQHDPLACAVATGWDEGIQIEEIPLVFEESNGWLFERVNAAGKPTRVVTRVNGPKFNEFWIAEVGDPGIV